MFGLLGFPLARPFPAVTEVDTADEIRDWSTPPVVDYDGWWDASDVSTISVASDLVSQWNDKSGNGYHMTASGGSSPGYGGTRNRTMSGITVLDFDGGDEMTSSYTINQSQVVLSAFMAFELDGSPNGTLFGSTLGAGAGQRVIDFAGTGGAARYYKLGGATPVVHAHAPSAGQPSVLGTSFSRMSFIIWQRDGYLDYGGYADTVFSTSALRLGNRGDGIDYNGAIAEVLVYNRVMEEDEFYLIMQYMRGKWGSP